jgi:SNF2 family DNA or RNA helicase
MNLTRSDGVALLLGMGLGKGLISISLANLMDAQKILIVCPVSVVGVWPHEFELHSKTEYNVVPLRKPGGGTLSVSKKAELAKEALTEYEPLIIVVNYESAWRKPLADLLLKQQWDLIIADEMHRFKTPTSKSARFMHKLSKRARKRLGLTGTEMPAGPLDVFSQYKFLNSNVLGSRYGSFKGRYSMVDRWNKVIGYINEDDLKAKIDVISYRASEDVLDLPEYNDITIDTPITGEAQRLHAQILDGMLAELADVDDEAVFARIVAAQLIRCAQVTGGFVGGVLDLADPDQEEPFTRWIKGSSKAEALKDILEDLPDHEGSKEKVVVFTRFKYDLEQIKTIAEEKGYRYGEISGRSKTGLSSESKFSPDCDLVGVQLQAGGVGIDLTAASYCIYWSKNYNLGDYEQSRKRVHRPGQTRPVIYYHFVAPETVDEQIMNSLEGKSNIIEFYREKSLLLKRP